MLDNRFHSSLRSTRRTDPPRRDIDVATGILIGLRGYSEREAFDELVRATHRTGAGISTVVRSLIAIAGGHRDAGPVYDAALDLWGHALTGRAVYS